MPLSHSSLSRRLLSATVGLLIFGFSATAQEIGFPSPDEIQKQAIAAMEDHKRRAIEIEQAHFDKLDWTELRQKIIPGLSGTLIGSARESVITRVQDGKHDTGQLPRYVSVERYDYSSGIAFRSIVDLQANLVARQHSQANGATPLSPSENERAILIATKFFPELKTNGPEGVRPFNYGPGSPRYGYRYASVSLPQSAPTGHIEINLHTEEAWTELDRHPRKEPGPFDRPSPR